MEETARAGCGEFYNTLHSTPGRAPTSSGSAARSRRCAVPAEMRLSGEHILAIGMTESGCGIGPRRHEDPGRGQGRPFPAERVQKTYISNGINADRGDRRRQAWPVTNAAMRWCCWWSNAAWRGSSAAATSSKMGLDAQDTAELFFDNVKRPEGERPRREPGRGFYYLMEGLAEERLIGACAYQRRRAPHAFDITRDYVSGPQGRSASRSRNSRTPSSSMAEMDTEIDMVQAYIDMCVAEHNQGRLTAEMGAKAKLASSEVEAPHGRPGRADARRGRVHGGIRDLPHVPRRAGSAGSMPAPPRS